MKQKIGLFFGSFDPIHNGHLQILNNSYFSRFNQIWLIVTPENPFKKGQIIASFYDRFKMINISINDNKKLIPSNIEEKLLPPYYTANTLSFLKEKYPDYNFEIIMGSDNYVSLANYQWYKSDYILKNFRIIVFPRGQKIIKSNPLLTVLDSDLISISSSDVRSSFLTSSNILHMPPIPMAVLEYIKTNNLYSPDSQ